MTELNEITIEDGGTVLRGVAVPFGQEALVATTGPDGRRVVHREVFDKASIVDVGALFGHPLLIGHDDNRPIGRIRSSQATDRGVEIEADLIGGADEVDGIRKRVGAGVQGSLSIGFYPSRGKDVWSTGTVRGELPLVVRRGVEIREVSIVTWPAFTDALITGVHLRTRQGERSEIEARLRRRKSEKVAAEMRSFTAGARARAARRTKSA